MRPINDRVLVRRIPPETITPGGLHIPDVARERPQRATVEAVGRGRYVAGEVLPLEVAVGQEVVLGKWVGAEIPGEPDLLIVREDDILAVLEAP